MKKAVAEILYKIFKSKVCNCERLSITQRKEMQNILDSFQWENRTEMDFFVQVKNSLEIQILFIDVEINYAQQMDTYKFFRLESNNWEISNIDDIINFETLILMYQYKQVYYIFETFTEEDIFDIRIVKLINPNYLFLVEIGIYLLMRDHKSLQLKSMCEHIYVDGINSYGKTLFQVLDENGRNDAIAFLLYNECSFPNSDILREIPLIKRRLESNIEFHELIENSNYIAVDEYLEANPNQQFIYNEFNKSACWVAFERRNFEVFNILYKKGLTLTNLEIYLLRENNEIYNYFPTKTFSGLDFNNKMQILESITHTTNKLANDLNVSEIYTALRKIPNVNLILNILNKIRHLYISIDYQESSSKMCFYSLRRSNGLYSAYLKRILVLVGGGGGTKQLLGTFALEVTYFAMKLVYNNNGKPYYSDDNKNHNRFNEIVQDIQEKVSNGSINEELIKSVFDHSEKYWHAELISCVNHIFGFYGDEKGKQILQQQTPELLTFYEIYVKPDLDKYLRCHFNENYNLFNTEFHIRMKMCDKYFHESNNLSEFIVADFPKNVMIKTDNAQLTCLKLFQNITRCNNDQLNIDNTYFIDLNTFSDNNFEIVSQLPKCDLLILFKRFEKPHISYDWGNISQHINTVGKRFILIADMKNNWSFDNVVTFIDSFVFTDIVGISEKLIFNTIKVHLQGRQLKLGEIINFEDDVKILSKPFIAIILLVYIFNPPNIVVGRKPTNLVNYTNRNFITTLFELDELRDEIMEKYLCENITDDSRENHFELRARNGQLVKFPGKTLSKKDYKPLSQPMKMSSPNSKNVYNDMNNDIFIISLNSSKSFIIIDEEKEIEINNFSYSDMKTFYENNNKFNIHWFLESDTSQRFFHHLKTFGSFDKTRSFCFREKSTIDEENLLKKLKNQKVFLIAAPAGMGKTETIQNMAANLVENDSSIWAPVIVLRQCTELLQTFHPENSHPDYLVDFLIKLLKFKPEFEKEMFKFWYKKKSNKICLFLDGADENGPEFTDKTIELIKRLSQTNIQYIIVSVRLNVKFEFELKLDTMAIEMEPLSYNDQIKCLINMWADESEINNKIEIARRVANHFRNFDDFLNNPLQNLLVANICKGKLTKFSQNLINMYFFFEDELSLFEMYKNLIYNKLVITLHSKPSLQGSLFFLLRIDDERYCNLLYTQDEMRYAAIRVLLNDVDVNLFLTSENIESLKTFIGDIQRWEAFEGIVDGIFSNKLNFVHRTYAEHFFADFLLNRYKAWNENTEQFFFDQILVKKEFEYVRKFLCSCKGSLKLLSRNPTYFQVPVTLHDAVRQNIEENNREILQYLHTLGFNITINPSTLITKFIYNDSPNSIEKLIDTITYLVTNCAHVHVSIDELTNIKMEILNQILPYKCIELIKALLKCDLIYESDNEFVKEQINSFQPLWNEAKDMAAHEDNEPKKLLQLFYEILQKIKINKK